MPTTAEVTQVESDSARRRRMIDTAGRSEADRWQQLMARAGALRFTHRESP